MISPSLLSYKSMNLIFCIRAVHHRRVVYILAIMIVLLYSASLQRLSAQPLIFEDSVYAPFPLPAERVTSTSFTMKFLLEFTVLRSVYWFSYQISPDSTFRSIALRGDYLGIDSTHCFRVDSLVRVPELNLKFPFVFISLPVNELQPATTYFYRARARLVAQGNLIIGGSRFLNTLGKITTLPARTESIPLLLSPTNIGQTNFVISWERVQGAQVYEVDVATDSAFTRLVTGFANQRINTLQAHVQRLVPQTRYFCRVRTVSASGQSAYSAPMQVTTLSAQQPYQADVVSMSRALNNTLGPTSTSATADLVYRYTTTDASPTNAQIDSTLRYLLTQGVPLDSVLVIDNNGCASTDNTPEFMRFRQFSRFLVRLKGPLHGDSLPHRVMLQSGFTVKTTPFPTQVGRGWQSLCGCRTFFIYHSFTTPVSVHEAHNSISGASIALVPNPASDEVQVRWQQTRANTTRLQVFDLAGREVLVLPAEQYSAGAQQRTLDVRSLAQGVYVCRLTSGTESVVQRLVVVR